MAKLTQSWTFKLGLSTPLELAPLTGEDYKIICTGPVPVRWGIFQDLVHAQIVQRRVYDGALLQPGQESNFRFTGSSRLYAWVDGGAPSVGSIPARIIVYGAANFTNASAIIYGASGASSGPGVRVTLNGFGGKEHDETYFGKAGNVLKFQKLSAPGVTGSEIRFNQASNLIQRADGDSLGSTASIFIQGGGSFQPDEAALNSGPISLIASLTDSLVNGATANTSMVPDTREAQFSGGETPLIP